MFVNVSFPISSFRTFTYTIPKSLKGKIKPGTCINAPLNKRLQVGFVVSLNSTKKYSGKILEIDSILEKDFHFPDELWDTLEWISKYYISPFGQVLKAAIPNSFIKPYQPKKVKFIKITPLGLEKIEYIINNKSAQKKVLMILSNTSEPIKISSLLKVVSSPYSVCNVLENKGLVKIIFQHKITDPFDIMSPGVKKNVNLSNEQQDIINKIKLPNVQFSPYLLHGVTGSGKTEVYLNLAQKIVKLGKSVLVLVPEISLTPQVASRFRNAFGSSVALWHSKMTKSEKGWTWKQLKKGKYSIVVGARSAIFTPLKNLGLIIVDEEQESTYKQENPAPRYNARDVAMIRGQNAKAIVLLTSATPCLESYYNALQNKFKLLKLSKRFGESIYPAVTLIDMKKENFNNEIKMFSKNLINAIHDRLKKSEQIIILHNRRGYSRIFQCLDCGVVAMCKNCSVALTYHYTDQKLHCHYCKEVIPLLLICESCNSNNINFTGIGTQKVENILKKLFVNAKIIRMDMDTVKEKHSHHKILKAFSNKKADILIGTQMIAKGLDFENVTLVGVINADNGLFFPDFRAGERIFQLIYQVSGRAGRRNKPGMAIIQTFNPDDIYIQTASMLDIKKFYNIALSQRQELNYPPFSRIGRIIFSGKDKKNVEDYANFIVKKLQGNFNFLILGPSQAPLEKIKGNWRSHIIIKTKNKKVGSINHYISKKIGFSIFESKWKGVRTQIDIDPISML